MKAPTIILVRPQLGENIGAVARSMKNFGLQDLRIVNPRDGWPNAKANEMAKHALDIITSARVTSTLAEALEGIHTLYATTIRPRDMVKVEYNMAHASEIIVNDPNNSAIMFGPERTGLANEEIALANAIVTIPVNPEYPSLNLAQAVTVASYEYFTQKNDSPTTVEHSGGATPASKEELANFTKHLEHLLDQSDFFKVPEKRQGMLHNIKNMFGRHAFTDQEIRTLHGIIRALTHHR